MLQQSRGRGYAVRCTNGVHEWPMQRTCDCSIRCSYRHCAKVLAVFPHILLPFVCQVEVRIVAADDADGQSDGDEACSYMGGDTGG